jgi:hypothetical protein|tara:strand:+ start:5010 stop:5624 length:615 start_codon:yes stop_codon:yes gene_type:complete
MGYLQTAISFVGLMSMILITYFLNETIFEETDPLQPMGSLCNVNSSGLLSPDDSAYDTRGLLYGPFSVRGTSFFAIIMALISISIGMFATKLDLDMDSTYETGSIFLTGEPSSYVTGIVYRLAGLSTALLMSMATILTVPALQLHQNALNVTKDSLVPDSCDGLGLTEVDRLDRLQAIFISSSAAVVMVIVMAYSIRYDRKASK